MKRDKLRIEVRLNGQLVVWDTDPINEGSSVENLLEAIQRNLVEMAARLTWKFPDSPGERIEAILRGETVKAPT